MKQFLPLLCIGILSYQLIANDGTMTYHNSPVTKADKERIISLLKSKKFLSEYNIYKVEKLKFKETKAKKCP